MKYLKQNLPEVLAILTVLVILGLVKVANAQDLNRQQASSILGTSMTRPDITILKTYTLTHLDGSKVPLNLIKYNSGECTTINGVKACVGGYTEHISNYTRKNDQEHPVDTKETIYLKANWRGKFSIQNFVHEATHACVYHYMSRPVCETNWRYSECQEALAYCVENLYEQANKI